METCNLSELVYFLFVNLVEINFVVLFGKNHFLFKLQHHNYSPVLTHTHTLL